MYYQSYPGIYVYWTKVTYRWDYVTRPTTVHRYYKTINDFLNWKREDDITGAVGYKLNDRICRAVVDKTQRRGCYGRIYFTHKQYCNNINCREHYKEDRKAALVVYDNNGKFYPPDVLIGLLRKKRAIPKQWNGNGGGKRKAAWYYRYASNFKQRKYIVDVEYNGYEIKRKPKERKYWESDYCWKRDKSWKSQSKRKRQWKSKS